MPPKDPGRPGFWVQTRVLKRGLDAALGESSVLTRLGFLPLLFGLPK